MWGDALARRVPLTADLRGVARLQIVETGLEGDMEARQSRLFMSEPSRHVPVLPLTWSAEEARREIDVIASDAISRLDPIRLWPSRPHDDNSSDGDTSLYIGATGVIWALDYLARPTAGTSAANIAFSRRIRAAISTRHRPTECLRTAILYSATIGITQPTRGSPEILVLASYLLTISLAVLT
jgi:hypothetical protein